MPEYELVEYSEGYKICKYHKNRKYNLGKIIRRNKKWLVFRNDGKGNGLPLIESKEKAIELVLQSNSIVWMD